MIFPSNSVVSLIVRLADLFGLTIDLSQNLLALGLDEQEVTEQLRYGRD